MTLARSPHRRLVAVVVASAAALAACTGDDDDADTTTTVQSTVVPDTVAPPPSTVPVNGALLVAEAIADPTVDAAEVTVTGSDAARYVELRRTSAQLFGDTLTARAVSAGAELCDADDCAVLDDAVTDASGRLVETLSVDGRPLAGRISGVGSLADTDGVVARVRVAYATNAGQLVVALVATNTTSAEVELFGFAGVYQPTEGGGGVEAAGSWGDGRLASGASGTLLLVFNTDALGGRLGLRGLLGDGLDVALDIAVPPA